MVQTRSGRKTEEFEEWQTNAPTPRKRKGRSQETRKPPSKKAAKKQERENIETGKQETEVKTLPAEKEQEPGIIEKGLIYFFYKPKVELKEVHGPEDVQRLYVLLWPAAPSIQEDEKKMKHPEGKMGTGEPERLIVLGKKKLPDVHKGKHEKFWGFVEKVSRNIDEVEEDLEARTYTTHTRGERHVEGARPVGAGVYAIVKHPTKGHTHLVYVLELPEEPTEVQKAFNIGKEGSFVVSVKNPDVQGPGSFLRTSKNVHYPPEVKNLLNSTKTGNPLKFAPLDPKLIDYEGSELLFIGAAEDIKAELGEAGEYIEELEEVDARKISSDKIWKELHLSKAAHPTEPVLRGKWK